MSNGGLFSLGSIDAVRPVFMIVMGVFLSLIAWRMAKTSGLWTARILVAGALMLGFGYAVILPLYEAGLISRFSPNGHANAASALGWHVVKLVVMNLGWLFFGLGVAMHANLLSSPAPRPRAQARSLSPHESIA